MFSGEHADPKGPKIVRTLATIAVMVLVVLGLSWVLRSFVFQAYEVPSGSMEQTIMTGDLVFAEKLSYLAGDPQAGDIVTFADPLVPGRTLVKRVIATGDQTVDLQEGRVVVDGVPLDEPYTNGLPSHPFDRTAVSLSYPYTVPEGELWVMGDNRTDSQDSRYFGSIKASSVSGHAVFVYWPLGDIGPLL